MEKQLSIQDLSIQEKEKYSLYDRKYEAYKKHIEEFCAKEGVKIEVTREDYFKAFMYMINKKA